ncbi:Hpt domain-containing protein [Bizionia sediminis]|uniref:Hpt domain-containing protein n=1 Tax=Bizionia sediminis TaxID=1737064 RepID=A0ABW5KMZ3_9FLAO
MEEHYKLFRVRELADGDEDFVATLAAAFLEEVPEDLEQLKTAVANKNYEKAYQTAHKMKPTIDLFELGVLDDLIIIQDWGKFTKTNEDVTTQVTLVSNAVENAVASIKSDFKL